MDRGGGRVCCNESFFPEFHFGCRNNYCLSFWGPFFFLRWRSLSVDGSVHACTHNAECRPPSPHPPTPEPPFAPPTAVGREEARKSTEGRGNTNGTCHITSRAQFSKKGIVTSFVPLRIKIGLFMNRFLVFVSSSSSISFFAREMRCLSGMPLRHSLLFPFLSPSSSPHSSSSSFLGYFPKGIVRSFGGGGGGGLQPSSHTISPLAPEPSDTPARRQAKKQARSHIRVHNKSFSGCCHVVRILEAAKLTRTKV